MESIPLSRPSLSSDALEAIGEVLDSGWLGEGAKTEAFEAAIADYTGAPHVIAVNTGTSAIHLALDVLGIGPGDDVVLPSFTYASDPAMVVQCGARPVFADIDPETLALDPRRVNEFLTPRTRAILVTDYGGLPSDVPSLRRALGERGDIRIIRDAAHSFGSLIDGRPLGVWSEEDATCFSFDPIKNLTCGDGGAILVNDPIWADRMRLKKRLGFRKAGWEMYRGQQRPSQRVEEIGFRYHLSDLNAAIGLSQLSRFSVTADRRRKIARLYDRKLSSHGRIGIFRRNYDAVVPFIYAVTIPSGNLRNIVAERMNESRIQVGLRYQPCHQEPVFRSTENHSSLPITEKIAETLLCLPLFPDLTDDEVARIVHELKTIVAEFD